MNSRKIKPNSLICEMPYQFFLELGRYLDTADRRRNWRALIAAIPDSPYSEVDVETFGLELVRHGGSPTEALLRDLGHRGYQVKQLVGYLENIDHQTALKLLKAEEKIQIIKQPISSSIMEDSEFGLRCEALGFPKPKYVWFKAVTLPDKNSQITKKSIEVGHDQVLKLSPAKLEDQGMYVCRIHNSLNYEFTNWVEIKVLPQLDPDPSRRQRKDLEAPVITIQPQSQKVQLGQPLRLMCGATGTPAPSYQWYRDHQYIVGEMKNELYYQHTTTRDEAIYTCRVWNKAGEVMSNRVEVNIIGGPIVAYHPVSQACYVGERAQFHCLAESPFEVTYQWYCNGISVPPHKGGNKSCLIILQASSEWQGVYKCEVLNQFGKIFSKEASLTLEPGITPPPGQSEYYATDKVALLIGNVKYRPEIALPGALRDTETMARLLKNMGFKVVSLIDLSLAEMSAAVDLFCELLIPGVYAIFYFAGHGFDSSGQEYLVPVDAPHGFGPEDCLCAQDILQRLQLREPALNLILLDMCRRLNFNAKKPVHVFDPSVRGNTVFGYAACHNTQAWEVEEENGIFVTYLKKYINNNERITTILNLVLEDINRDTQAKDCQFPQISTTLRENRSLLDTIKHFPGQTQELSYRAEMWQTYIDPPQTPLILTFSEYQIDVHLEFSAEFSNVLKAVVQVVKSGVRGPVQVTLNNFPNCLDLEIVAYPPSEQMDTFVAHRSLEYRIKNIQKLETNLEMEVVVNFFLEKEGKTVDMRHSLSFPPMMIAKSNLSEIIRQQREPVEVSFPSLP